jgi:ribosomal-protein-alanine N-acetyltransferase
VRRHILDRNCSVVVARSDQRVVAFALMYFGDEIGHLNLLAVDPQWRRQYCGRRLMEWLLASAEVAGIKRIDLELRAENTGAKLFYESVGFVQTSIRPRYYQGVESALGMRLVLLKD